MEDNEHGKQDEKERRERFKAGLREACDAALDGKPDAIRRFFCDNPDVPKGFRGDRDRTYGYFHATTILRTFGADEGIAILAKARPCSDQEAETAYFTVAGVGVDAGNPEAAWLLVRRQLAWQCALMGGLIARAMRLDPDHGQHHALATLADECRWCAREVCGVKEEQR